MTYMLCSTGARAYGHIMWSGTIQTDHRTDDPRPRVTGLFVSSNVFLYPKSTSIITMMVCPYIYGLASTMRSTSIRLARR